MSRGFLFGMSMWGFKLLGVWGFIRAFGVKFGLLLAGLGFRVSAGQHDMANLQKSSGIYDFNWRHKRAVDPNNLRPLLFPC